MYKFYLSDHRGPVWTSGFFPWQGGGGGGDLLVVVTFFFFELKVSRTQLCVSTSRQV